MADFRRVFHPTVEEQIQDYELLLKLHKEQLGCCSTCANHIPSDMPGFVTDYGECSVGSSVFVEKVCGLAKTPCPLYTDNSAGVDLLTQKIERLRQKRRLEGGEDKNG